MVLLFLVVNAFAFASDKNCFVTGVSVDKNNNPVADARIIAYTPPSGWEDLIVSYKSDEDGRFSVETPCKSGNANLFVSPPLDYENNFIPLSPPFWISSKMYKNITAIKLPIINKGEFNIGKVVVPDYYKIEVKFEDEKGNWFLPEKLDFGFWIRVKTVKGELVKWGSLSARDFKNAQNSNKSSILMTLPEGKWILEVGFNEDKKPYFYPDKIIDLNDSTSNEIQKITLKMSTKKTIK